MYTVIVLCTQLLYNVHTDCSTYTVIVLCTSPDWVWRCIEAKRVNRRRVNDLREKIGRQFNLTGRIEAI